MLSDAYERQFCFSSTDLQYLLAHMADQVSPSALRSSFKPSNLKSIQTLHNFQPKMEESKVSQSTSALNSYGMRGKTEVGSAKLSDTKITKDVPKDTKTIQSQKKFSAQFDPTQIPAPKNKDDAALNKFVDQTKSQPVFSKEDLRTTFTANTFVPKTFDKEMLRKTTHTPFRLDIKPEIEKQQKVPETPPPVFKKPGYQKKLEIEPKSPMTPMTPITPIKSPAREPPVKRSPIVCGFMLGKNLGSGQFGQVMLAKHCITGFICALKKISKERARETHMIPQLTQQIKLHSFCQSPNIVQLYGWVSDESHIYLIMEYMPDGTLFDHMNDPEKQLTQLDAVGFVREVTKAVKYLHDINVAHRDIKPENIVLSYGVAKLCDFGWAARMQGARKTYCGTFDYAPPQILQRKQYDETVDLWCLGILTYELLTGKVPFQDQDRKTMMQKIVNVDKELIEYPQGMSSLAKDFIKQLVKKNPAERMKSYKLLGHPFLDRPQPKKKE